MSGYGMYYSRPALKNSVDVQLQTAFNDGLWPNVVRLAAQRYKAKKDPYYEVGWFLMLPPLSLTSHLTFISISGYQGLRRVSDGHGG